MELKCGFWAGIILLTVTVFSCGGRVSKTAIRPTSANFEENRTEAASQKAESPYLKGLAKIQENDCPSCHALESKNLGPSYAAVAERYENTEETVAMLTERIISGSVGSWGEIPMTAQIGRASCRERG